MAPILGVCSDNCDQRWFELGWIGRDGLDTYATNNSSPYSGRRFSINFQFWRTARMWLRVRPVWGSGMSRAPQLPIKCHKQTPMRILLQFSIEHLFTQPILSSGRGEAMETRCVQRQASKLAHTSTSFKYSTLIHSSFR